MASTRWLQSGKPDKGRMTFSLIQSDAVGSALSGSRFETCGDQWLSTSENLLSQRPHGDSARWFGAISDLPNCMPETVGLDQDVVTACSSQPLEATQTEIIEHCLRILHPWRKGPFNILGVEIDSEWRSNLKWSRIVDGLSPLEGRHILDVGCGNGYYLYRMLGQGARLAMGIDPTQLFLAQFAAINHYIRTKRALILPMRSEDLNLPDEIEGFDTVFSMGVYYHRRDPVGHLNELRTFLRSGGELVLETLVIPGKDGLLIPQGRYAQMRNVWQIPTVDRLTDQLQQNGFDEVNLIDLCPTTVDEQRSTDWMTFESLANFLDPENQQLTIEVYPAPLRACVRATRN